MAHNITFRSGLFGHETMYDINQQKPIITTDENLSESQANTTEEMSVEPPFQIPPEKIPLFLSFQVAKERNKKPEDNSSVRSQSPFFCHEKITDFDFEFDESDDNRAETSSTDSGSEHSSPKKASGEPTPKISPSKIPLELRLHNAEKQYRDHKANPDVAYLVRQSVWLQAAMGACGNAAEDAFKKAVQTRKNKEHDRADQYDSRTNECMYQFHSAAESFSKVRNAISQGLDVIPTKKN